MTIKSEIFGVWGIFILFGELHISSIYFTDSVSNPFSQIVK